MEEIFEGGPAQRDIVESYRSGTPPKTPMRRRYSIDFVVPGTLEGRRVVGICDIHPPGRTRFYEVELELENGKIRKYPIEFIKNTIREHTGSADTEI